MRKKERKKGEKGLVREEERERDRDRDRDRERLCVRALGGGGEKDENRYAKTC